MLVALPAGRSLRARSAAPGCAPLAAFVAAQPALLYGYALWGGVKEVAAPRCVARGRPRRRAGARLDRAVVESIARCRAPLRDSAAGDRRRGPGRRAQPRRAGLAGADAAGARRPRRAPPRRPRRRAAGRSLFAAAARRRSHPGPRRRRLPPTSSRGRLQRRQATCVGPLSPLQALGIWPSGDFRFDPDGDVATAVLIALGDRRRAARPLGGLAPARRRAAALREQR